MKKKVAPPSERQKAEREREREAQASEREQAQAPAQPGGKTEHGREAGGGGDGPESGTGSWEPAERPVSGPVEREPRPDREAGTEGSRPRELERWSSQVTERAPGPAGGIGAADSPRGMPKR
jgi:hypothetical protein